MNSEYIIHVTDATFEKEVLNSKEPVLVCCYEWNTTQSIIDEIAKDYGCEWNTTQSMIDEIAKDYEGYFKVVTINIDNNKVVRSKYQINDIPSYLIFINGEVADTRLIHNIPKSRIIEVVNEYIGKLPYSKWHLTLEHIINVTDDNYEEEVLNSKIPVLLCFWKWNSTSFILNKIAKEYEGKWKIVKLNMEEYKLIASRYQIYNYNNPSILLYIDEEMIDTGLDYNSSLATVTENINYHINTLPILKKKREQEIEQKKEQERKIVEQYERQRKLEEEIEMLKAIENKWILTSIHGDNPGFNLNSSCSFSSSLKNKNGPEYNPETKILIVEYFLPNKESMPTLKELKYIKKDNKYKEIRITETQRNKLFDSLMYQLTLRLISEQFKTDTENKISSICFNGWVHSINKATGKHEDVCILSISVKKEQFLEIELSNVDPKACFKHFKGVGCAALSSITPIPPILQINKADKRIVQSHDVIQDLEDETNLAAMDWQDFEHLVRELFEKEFMQNGGEVKVTQASRDGGVDAIAFDPDPIRGGKIIIQAKRYTNIVGVSAVRDLYGTVINEGATKGILITTADFGPDAYDFAKDKPITLLNGGHLLFMVQKHGQ